MSSAAAARYRKKQQQQQQQRGGVVVADAASSPTEANTNHTSDAVAQHLESILLKPSGTPKSPTSATNTETGTTTARSNNATKKSEDEYYEALQLAQSVVRRKLKLLKTTDRNSPQGILIVEEALQVAYASAQAMLVQAQASATPAVPPNHSHSNHHNNNNEVLIRMAASLLTLLVQVLQETHTLCDDQWLEKIQELHELHTQAMHMDKDTNKEEASESSVRHLQRLHLEWLHAVVAWSSSECGSVRLGDLRLHEMVARWCWSLCNNTLDNRLRHELAEWRLELQTTAIQHACLAELPLLIAEWLSTLPMPTFANVQAGHMCPPALRDRLLTRAVLSLVGVENVRDANILVRQIIDQELFFPKQRSHASTNNSNESSSTSSSNKSSKNKKNSKNKNINRSKNQTQETNSADTNQASIRSLHEWLVSYTKKDDGYAPSHLVFCCMLLRTVEKEAVRAAPLFQWLLRSFQKELQSFDYYEEDEDDEDDDEDYDDEEKNDTNKNGNNTNASLQQQQQQPPSAYLHALLAKIGKVYFRIQPPPSMLNMLENMMSMMGGGGGMGGMGGGGGMNPAFLQAAMAQMQGGGGGGGRGY